MSTLLKVNNGFPVLNSSFFDDFFTRDLFDWNDKNFSAMGNTLPSVNVKETDKNYEIELAVPGMRKDDFNVELNNNVLQISSEKEERKEEKDKKGNFVRKEFNYQSFSRAFTLPDSIDDGKIDAEYRDGILHILIAKKEPAKMPPTKRIAIK